MKKSDWDILKAYGISPDNKTVEGSLDLEGTAIENLPKGLSVGGKVYGL